MASATIVGTGVCAGGNHVSTRTTVGAQTWDFQWTADELLQVLNDDEVKIATLLLARLHCRGMTKAQAKAELVSPGISVVTS